MCPDGWTLTGDWECGVPTLVGPATAYVGTQCLGTKIAANYSNQQTYVGTTATSPDIDLTGAPSSLLTFRMWIDTEGSTYDGVNLKVSTDGGMSYTVVTGVSPAYPLTIATQPAWGGHQSGLGWQLMQADLAPYAGQVVRLRFSFQTDTSGVFPGVYIDDIFIN
jgi:bacillopeptidase F (M6 metalloprotease family)